jgi:hypothetical protein
MESRRKTYEYYAERHCARANHTDYVDTGHHIDPDKAKD